jgi:hypothetical protein
MFTAEQIAKMKPTELKAALESIVKQQATGLQVKLNKSGGVYIRHDSFKEFSASKSKEYVAGINVPLLTALALFGNPELCKQIHEQIKNLGK